tara:strand:- start:913 stop:3069 length:2157 start_codon:yes stop_codon:yes gene_type:complete
VILSNRLLPRVLTQVLPATIVALLAIGYIAHLSVRDAALDTHRKKLERVAAQSATSLGVVLRNVVDTAHTLAGNDLVINSLIDLSGRDGYIPALFQSLRIPGSERARVTLADFRGRRIAANAPGEGSDYSAAVWQSGVMKGQEFVRTDADGMIVAVPVYIAGLVEGMVVIEIDAFGFSDLVRLPVQSDGYAITTTAGDTVYASEQDLVRPDDAGSGTGVWMSVDATLRGFPNLWLVIGDRMSTVLVPIERQKTFLLVAILLSILAVTAGILVTAFKVVKPIRTFIAGVESVGNSADLSYRMEPFGADEFRRLTESFNTMLSRIVERRTEELSRGNAMLSQARQRLLDAIEAMPNGFMLFNADSNLVLYNSMVAELSPHLAAELKPGISKRRLAELDLREKHPEYSDAELDEQVDILRAKNRAILAQENPEPIEYEMKPGVWRRRYINRTADGGSLAVTTDITDITIAHQNLLHYSHDLERSNADLEQFAYVASHDLKAPLRAIDNLAGWIEEDAAEHMSEDSREHMTMLRGRVVRLEALLEGLLRYARAGRDTSDISWVETGPLVSEVVEMLGDPDTVHVAIPENMPRMRTSATALQQVFRNLIGNAVKHHDGDEARIRIDCRDLGATVEFSVIDDGPGIPERYHDRIFQMFQTLKRRDELEGSGLGLAMVRKLVQTHGGEIEVVSREGERGSVFRFTWATCETPAAEVSRREARNAA